MPRACRLHAVAVLVLVLALTCLLGALAADAGAATLPADSTAILSGTPSLLAPLPVPVDNTSSARDAVSQDARFVAFTSASDGLSTEDDDAVTNVYVRDRVTGAVTLASRRTGAAGEPSHGFCGAAAISDDGKRVAFVCSGPLDTADTNNNLDVYVRDLTTHDTFLASRAAGATGAVGNGASREPTLNEDGSRVAFSSSASNLGAPFQTITTAVYLRVVPLAGRAETPTTILVSRGNGGNGDVLPNDDSRAPSISDDGILVVFQSRASNLIGQDDTNGVDDVFVRNVQSGGTVLLSRKDGFAGALANGPSALPALSGNGQMVTFISRATNLDPADTTNDFDVYRHQLPTALTTLVDKTGGQKATGGVNESPPAIDDSGNVIAFTSPAHNLGPGATNTVTAVYVARNASSMTLASRRDGAAGTAARDGNTPSVSGDGKRVGFITRGSITGDTTPGVQSVSLRDLDANTTNAIARPAGVTHFDNQGGQTFETVVSGDGRFAAFFSQAPALGVPADAPSGIVVRDTVTGAAELASRADGPGGAPFTDDVGAPAISADGRRVAFSARPPGGPSQIWLRDRRTGSTVLVSRASGPNGAPGDGDSIEPTIDAAGDRVAFVSQAKNLGDGDTDATFDAHVRDLTANMTILASRADGAAGAKAADGRVDRPPSISADGRHVAFSTTANNLGDGDTDTVRDVHVRDLDAQTTRLASVSAAGTKGNDTSDNPAIDAHGTRVAFASAATNLGATPARGQELVWVRDLGAGTTLLASRADGAAGAPADGDAFFPSLSASGRVVAFQSTAKNLGVPSGPRELYRRDLDANTTRIVSVGPGPAAVPAPFAGAALGGNVTADGACVAFETRGDLIAPVTGGDITQSFLRTFAADCGRPSPGVATGGGDGPTGPPRGRDTIRPVLRSVSLSPTRFRAAKARSAITAARRRGPIPRGTRLRFTASEQGRLTLLIERAVPGRLIGTSRRRTCRPAPHRPRHGRCTAYRRTVAVTRAIRARRGQLTLTGRIGRRPMAPGAYRLTLSERDAAGNVSRPVRRTFTIVAG